jgi:hypothetical protein
VRHLFELLYGDVRMAIIIAARLEEDSGPQDGFH